VSPFGRLLLNTHSRARGIFSTQRAFRVEFAHDAA
jgi:hypothetical protein